MKKIIFLVVLIIGINLIICKYTKNIKNESMKIEELDSEIVIEKNENIFKELEIPEYIETLNNVKILSNETCSWGFRRMKDGKRPELYKKHTDILDKYKGIYCGNSGDKIVYLTFDEGYENGYTKTILDTLKEKNIKASFFVTLPYVKQNEELVKRMIEEGHIVGNHTVNHPSMPSILDEEKFNNEILELHNYVKEKFNYEMKYLRPPKGEYSERTVKKSKDLGYYTVLWSSAYADWNPDNQKGKENAKKIILDNLHNGSVILLHAVSKDNNSVLGEVIDEIINRGYEIKELKDFKY